MWGGSEPFLQVDAVDVFHDDALCLFLRGGEPQALYAQTADDAWMLQPHEDFHLLQEHLLVGGTALKLWLECLEEIPPPEALGAIELVCVRLVDELKVGEATLQLLESAGLEVRERVVWSVHGRRLGKVGICSA